MRTIISIMSAFLTMGISPSYALDIDQYEELKVSSKSRIETYIYGLGSGYSRNNSFLTVRDDKAFYCPPAKMTLNARNYIDILDRKIGSLKKEEGIISIPVEMILHEALIDTFPCTKKKQT